MEPLRSWWIIPGSSSGGNSCRRTRTPKRRRQMPTLRTRAANRLQLWTPSLLLASKRSDDHPNASACAQCQIRIRNAIGALPPLTCCCRQSGRECRRTRCLNSRTSITASPFGQMLAVQMQKQPQGPSRLEERKERSNSRRQSELAMNLQASLKDMEDAAAAAEAAQLAEDSFALQAAQERLQVRLGALSPQKLITGDELHETLVALGLTSYGREETNMLLNVLADFIKLRFDQDGPRLRRGASLLFRKSHAALGLGTPVWEWPRPQNTGSRRISERMTQGVGRRKSELMGRGGLQSAEPERNFNVAP
ncbi:unnamed protein product [Effrenium voratum]|nr:unnamed protein product [Effrenium voratum]